MFLLLCEEPLPGFNQSFAVTMLRWQSFTLFRAILPVYPKNLTNHDSYQQLSVRHASTDIRTGLLTQLRWESCLHLWDRRKRGGAKTVTKNSSQLLYDGIVLEKKKQGGGLYITRLNTDTGRKMCRHGQLCLWRYLGGAQDVEHQWQAHGDQLPAVVLLSDGGELSEQRQGDARPGLLLGTTQRFQPHVKLPWYTLIKRGPKKNMF